ncbi:MAG: hypothetical protein GOMPHAMPRED_006742 [Gomphillus americanus]|uniref:Fe2OG dioxygenase domain-containing protein n=1 Tax=Gomphillus americanus TaxID=1940652 RepID=A0A8H3IDA4_9LECA|nr:MAG: hypothetical protein GOMPHAMPRED_006742 [Gomphillus americanus]
MTIPTFSLTELRKGIDRELFCNCLESQGVFYLKIEDFIDAQHEPARATALDFFEHASETQRAALLSRNPKSRRGFSMLESESTAQITNNGLASDYSMSYSMGVSKNIFPTQEFEQTWTAYFHHLYLAAQDLAEVVLDACGVKAESGRKTVLDYDPLLRLRYYPEVPQDRVAEVEPLRMASHYDLSLITLIHQTPCPNRFTSLQYETEGGFVDLPVVSDTMLVFCGAVASILSHGRIKAPQHRVAAPDRNQRIGSSRTSSVFFLRPSDDFSFSVQEARKIGFDVSHPSETSTFKEWIEGNYVNIKTQE